MVYQNKGMEEQAILQTAARMCACLLYTSSASGSSFFFEKFLLTYSAAVRTFSMVLAASF